MKLFAIHHQTSKTFSNQWQPRPVLSLKHHLMGKK